MSGWWIPTTGTSDFLATAAARSRRLGRSLVPERTSTFSASICMPAALAPDDRGDPHCLGSGIGVHALWFAMPGERTSDRPVVALNANAADASTNAQSPFSARLSRAGDSQSCLSAGTCCG